MDAAGLYVEEKDEALVSKLSYPNLATQTLPTWLIQDMLQPHQHNLLLPPHSH